MPGCSRVGWVTLWRWKSLAGHHRHRQSTGETAVMNLKKSSMEKQERLLATAHHNTPMNLRVEGEVVPSFTRKGSEALNRLDLEL